MPVLILLLLIALPVAAARPGSVMDCFMDGDDPSVRLAACNKTIADLDVTDALRARAFLSRAEVRRTSLDFEGALADLDAAIELGGGDTAARLSRALFLNGLGRPEEALDELDLVLGTDPSSSEAYTLRGDIFFRLGETDLGMRDLAEALRLNPDDPGPFRVRGRTFLRAGDATAAVGELEQAYALEPGDRITLSLLGTARLHAGQPAAAIKAFDKLIAQAPNKAPDNMETRMTRAAAQGQVRNFAAAIGDYTVVLETRPDDMEAREARGVARLFNDEPAGAEADFTAMLAQHPGNQRVSLFRGSARFAQQKYAEAAADFDDVLDAFPNDADTRLNRGLARLALGRPDDAIEDFTVAINEDPDLELAQRRRAQAYVLTGAFADAVGDFDALFQKRGAVPRAADAVWRFIAAKRSGSTDATETLKRMTQGNNPTVWPGALVDGLEGQVNVDAVVKEAVRDPEEAAARLTETRFVLGQLALADGQIALARENFTAAVDSGSVDLIEYQGAVLELQRINNN